MDTNKEKTKGEDDQKKTKVRITLTCKNVKNVEKVTKQIIERAKQKESVEVHGPVRMPVKSLKITVRKSPCGEGSKTFDRWEMKIYKRVIDLICTTTEIKDITSITIDPGVEVELAMSSED